MIKHTAYDESALLARLRCSLCYGALTRARENEAVCVSCGKHYRRIEGIWGLLTEQQLATYANFLKSYPALRVREGWERDQTYYLRLPDVADSDPAAAVWRIRRRSLRVLEDVLQSRAPSAGGAWALDLGAGNGWLARRLAKLCYRTVALDLNVTGSDSLAGGQLYIEHDGIWFDRLQASMDTIPFADNTFSLCTISSALYYANTAQTVESVYRVLQPGGLLAITDSPVYSTAAPGVLMANEQRKRIKGLTGAEPSPLPGGAGFLVQSQIVAEMRDAGFQVRVISTQRPLGLVKRRLLQLARPGRREEALFPVIIGVKPNA